MRKTTAETARGYPSVLQQWPVVLSFIISTVASAHHSEAGFDKTTIAAFEGIVTEFDWRNPHVYVLVETTGSDGRPIEWRVETSSTPILSRRGWNPDALRRGERIMVRGHPERGTGRNYALLLALQKADGTILTAAPLKSESEARTSGLSGIWKPDAATVADFHERIGNLALTDKGAAARDSFEATVAEQLVRHKLEQIRARPADLRDGAETVGLDETEYVRSWTVRRDTPRAGIAEVRVQVTWSEYSAPLVQPLSTPLVRTLSDPLDATQQLLDSSGRM